MKNRKTHVHEDAYYEISNGSVSTSFFFASESDVRKFKSKMEKHFKGLCKVVVFGFRHEEFRFVVKMFSRRKVVKYFLRKYPKAFREHGKVPQTAFIFAKVMADLQGGYAKYFNFKYARSGALVEGRYLRNLLRSKEEVDQRIADIHAMKVVFYKTLLWRYKQKMGFKLSSLKNAKGWSSKELYRTGVRSKNVMSVFSFFREVFKRGDFRSLPPERIVYRNKQEKYENLVGFMMLQGG